MIDKFKSASGTIKYCVIMPLVLAVLYFIAIADLAYGYYTFIRIISLVMLGIFIVAYCMVCDQAKISLLNFPNITAAIILILFNPIFPIYMDKSTWIVFDVIAAIAMVAVSIFVLCNICKTSD